MKTRMLKKTWLLFTFFPLAMHAQKQLSGTIQSTSGEAISGARIQIEETYQGTFSKDDGSYAIQNIRGKSIVVHVKMIGYEPVRQTVQLDQEKTVWNVQLTVSPLLMEEMLVVATRANEKTPTTYSMVTNEQLKQNNYGQDVPYLLEGTPSTVVTSDAGAGIGYTGIRIRGVDPTRTNVTINGIPVNDAESHGTFWVNMPDLASSVDNIQVQRGVGTSANGAAAFGASINIKTDQINRKAYGELDQSVGSFNTLRNTIKLGTGLIDNRFVLDARLSRISSEGYIDRASANLKSYYLSGAWFGKKSSLRATVFGGQEITYQAWYGTPESVLFGTEEDKIAYADRNGLSAKQRENLLNAGRKYNFYDYANEVDNYRQDHYHLHFNHQFSPYLNLQISGHYTYGRGFYEQYRSEDDLADYGLSPVILESDTVTTSDLIRRRWLDNHFYGGVYALNFTKIKGLNLTLGGAANQYVGDHFGEIIWSRYASNSEIYDEYYRNDAKKTDITTYLRGTYSWKKFIFYADAQVRYIDYTFLGIDDVSDELKDIQQNVNYTFFNPKAGISYKHSNQSSFFASYSIAHREPVRADFRESTPERRPTFEQLGNLEIGHRWEKRNYYVNSTIYWMNYQDQLILTGQINDVGGYTRTNVDKSYRAGFELEGGYRIRKNLTLSANAAFSQNKVAEFTEFVDDYDNGGQAAIIHKNTDLAFSPNIIAGIGLNYEPIKNLRIHTLVKHVGKQFLDNTSNDSRSIRAYSFGNVGVNYTLKTKGSSEFIFGVLVNNVWDALYENNGYTFSYIYGGNTTTENFYYPQAGRNFLARLTIRF